MLNLELSTVIFQVINFLILLVVLTRFLYQPVLRTMQQRQEAIAARLREADERGRQAGAEREQLAQQAREAKVQAEQLLAQARAEAAAERARLLEGAREDAARFQEEAQRAIQEEERAALGRLEQQIRATTLNVAGSLVRQAAGPAVHQALLDRLLDGRIPTGAAEEDALRRAVASADSQLVVQMAYPASAELQQHLRETLLSRLATDGRTLEVTFQVEPDLFAGARILAGQHVVIDLSLERTLADMRPVTDLHSNDNPGA